MAKVYVLTHDLEHEGEDLIGVFSEEGLAVKRVSEKSPEYSPPRRVESDLWMEHPRISQYGYWVREVEIDA